MIGDNHKGDHIFIDGVNSLIAVWKGVMVKKTLTSEYKGEVENGVPRTGQGTTELHLMDGSMPRGTVKVVERNGCIRNGNLPLLMEVSILGNGEMEICGTSTSYYKNGNITYRNSTL